MYKKKLLPDDDEEAEGSDDPDVPLSPKDASDQKEGEPCSRTRLQPLPSGDKKSQIEANERVVQVDDTEDGDDGEVRSRSGSCCRLRLETDYHHIPETVTIQRGGGGDATKQMQSVRQREDDTLHNSFVRNSESLQKGHEPEQMALDQVNLTAKKK